MYESFYGLQRRPFASAPDPDDFIPVESTQKALSDLIRSMQAGVGIGVLTAPAGLGKSLVCRKLATEICDRFATITISSANFPTRRALLQAILYELDRPYKQMDEQELRLELTTAVRDFARDFEAVAIIFDEAHLLSARLLEEIRSITNLVENGASLVRVALSGQLALEEKLAEPELAALNQRIGCQVVLVPLSMRESADYIRRRLQYSGATQEIFNADAIQAICQASDGSPRCLNQLADHSLMLGYLAGEQTIGLSRVHEALRDLQQLPLHWNVSSAVLDPIEQLNAEVRRVRERSFEPPTAAEVNDLKQVESHSRELKAEIIEIGAPEAVASFEIGGEEPLRTKAESPVELLRKLARQTAAPEVRPTVRAAKPTAAKFEEELVIDPYAKLDAFAPVSAKRNFMQRPATKPAKASGSQKGTAGPRPTAEELDQRIEGLILLIDDALDAPNAGFSAPIDGVEFAGNDRRGITVSVDVDVVRGIRVQTEGILSAVNAEFNSAAAKRTSFDVVLPEDDRHTSLNDESISESHAADSSEKPHRPYEQLFSELRRRKGA